MQIHDESNSITTYYIRYPKYAFLSIYVLICGPQLGMSVFSMVTKCRNRTVVIVTSISYLLPDGGSQTTKTKLMYMTLLAWLRNIVDLWSKMTMKYNEINTELKVTEKAIVFLRIGQAEIEEIISLVTSIRRTEGVNFL
jgi:hypothetical protein